MAAPAVTAGLPYLGEGGRERESEISADAIKTIAGTYGVGVFCTLLIGYMKYGGALQKRRRKAFEYFAFLVGHYGHNRSEWEECGAVVWLKAVDHGSQENGIVDAKAEADTYEEVDAKKYECARMVAVQFTMCMTQMMLTRRHSMVSGDAMGEVGDRIRQSLKGSAAGLASDLVDYLAKMGVDTEDKIRAIGMGLVRMQN